MRRRRLIRGNTRWTGVQGVSAIFTWICSMSVSSSVMTSVSDALCRARVVGLPVLWYVS